MEINSISDSKDSKNVSIPNQDNAFVFVDVKIIMSDRVLACQTVNRKYQIEFLSKVRERIRGKEPQLQLNGWGSASGQRLTEQCHIDLRVSGKKKQAHILDHRSYSSDLSVYGSFPFHKLKCLLIGRHLQSAVDIRKKR